MRKPSKRFVLWLLILLVGTSLLTGCGQRAQADEDLFAIREARPTFTPTSPSVTGSQASTGTGSEAPTTASVAGTSATGASAADTSTAGTANNNAAASVSSTDAAPAQAEAVEESSPPAASAETTDSTAASSGRVVINTPLVNGREGPDTDYPVVGIVGRGEEYDVIGRNAAGDWWNVCCYEEQPFWVINELVDTIGVIDIESVAITEPGASGAAVAAAVTATPEPATTDPEPVAATATPAEAQPAPTPTLASASSSSGDFSFDLQLQEQFPETNVVRVYAYVYNQDTQALEGYSVRVTKDGAELPVSEISFGPQAGFTWPVAEPRQRFQNLKIEFPGEDPAGVWTVQLTDGSGNIVGPAATFELTSNEPQQELYVRYEQR